MGIKVFPKPERSLIVYWFKLRKPSVKKTTKFSHLDESGSAHMVDVGAKPVQRRIAVAEGILRCQPATIRALKAQDLPKGDVLAVARIAGILAAKQTDRLIPLCHSLPLESVNIEFTVKRDSIVIICEAATAAKTGVEMEALTGVSVAGLTLFDMMKAVDKGMVMEGIRVTRKEKQ